MKRFTRWLKTWRLLPLVLACLACGSELPPPCDSATAGAIAAACAARVQTECVAKNVPQEECTVIDECDAQAEARTKRCGGGK